MTNLGGWAAMKLTHLCVADDILSSHLCVADDINCVAKVSSLQFTSCLAGLSGFLILTEFWIAS